jgi:hypothetical protein
MHVVAEVGDTRVSCSIPAGERGSWARTLAAGQGVRLSFDPMRARFFDETGARVQHTPQRAGVVGSSST